MTRTLLFVERRTDRIFYPAPDAILKTKSGTSNLRERYQLLCWQLESLQPIFLLFALGMRFWQRQSRRHVSKLPFSILRF